MDDEEDIFFRNPAAHAMLNASSAHGLNASTAGLNASGLLNASAMGGLNASTIGLHTSMISTVLMNASTAANALNASGM